MRQQGWEARLSALIEVSRTKPFEWGRHDCCLFAADAVMAINGVDPAADLRGNYSSAVQAADLVAKLGGLDAIPPSAGFEEVPVKYAHRGDVVLCETAGRDVLGVVDMSGLRVAVPGEEGLVFLPIAAGLKAWRI